MRNSLHHIIALALTLLIAGCGIVPALQITGAALTGYDAVVLADEAIPRASIESGEQSADMDRVLERRLRERLKINGHQTVSAHVIRQQAYMVGRVSGRSAADRIVEVASTVQGITTVHCKFYPMSQPRRIQHDARLKHELAEQLRKTEQLNSARIHVEVIEAQAILIGQTWTFDQKAEAMGIASRLGGIREVVDYILVKEQPKTTKDDVA